MPSKGWSEAKSDFLCNGPPGLCKDQDCIVRKELVDMEKADVVLMVFHKLLSNPSLLNKFDVIIFDESHRLIRADGEKCKNAQTAQGRFGDNCKHVPGK